MSFKNFDEKSDICNLDDIKVCTSCEKCLSFSENDYIEIKLEGLIKEEMYKDYFREFKSYKPLSDDRYLTVQYGTFL